MRFKKKFKLQRLSKYFHFAFVVVYKAVLRTSVRKYSLQFLVSKHSLHFSKIMKLAKTAENGTKFCIMNEFGLE